LQADLLTPAVRVQEAEDERLAWIAKGFPWYAQDPLYLVYFPAEKKSGDITPSVAQKVSKSRSLSDTLRKEVGC
jgi:hypothetical protein